MQGRLRTRLRFVRWKLLLGGARAKRGLCVDLVKHNLVPQLKAKLEPMCGPMILAAPFGLDGGFAPVLNSVLSLDALLPAAFSPVLLSQESFKACLMNKVNHAQADCSGARFLIGLLNGVFTPPQPRPLPPGTLAPWDASKHGPETVLERSWNGSGRVLERSRSDPEAIQN